MSVRRRSRDPSRLTDEDEPNHSSHLQPRVSSPRWRYSALVFALLIVTFTAYWLRWQKSHVLDLFPAQHGLALDESVLHPQTHINRPPTTIQHKWRMAKELRRPDGVLKNVYCINGKFPGPTLEARPGDQIIIEVENGIDDEGLSIHWHGLLLKNTNHMDGAAGITQRPIEAGDSHIYNFTIGHEEHGTFWYHAHDQVQRADGLYGGLVVHDVSTKNEPSGPERLLLVGDWYHRTAEEALTFYTHPGSFGNEPVPDSILLNGQGIFNCNDGVPARPIDCKRRTTSQLPSIELDGTQPTILRVVNVGSYAGIQLAVDGARLTPIKVDAGHEVSADSANAIGYLHPGERMDVVIEATDAMTGPSSLLSLTLDTSPFKYPNPSLTSMHEFPLSWQDFPHASLPDSKGLLQVFDLDNIKSAEDQSALMPTTADQIIVLYAITQKLSHLRNEPRGFINNTSWQPQVEPPGPLLALQREQWDKNQFVPRIPYAPGNSLWLDIVLNNLDEEDHPFHLHGYNFWVLSKCSSTYNWGSYNPFEDDEAPGGEYDLVGAVKKDTVVVPNRGYAVLRARMDNPGIWMFHCHNLWHQASGMAMAFEIS